MKRFVAILLACCLVSTMVLCQSNYVKGELLVLCRDQKDLSALSRSQSQREYFPFQVVPILNAPMPVALVTFDADRHRVTDLINLLKQEVGVIHVQQNAIITERIVPNDSLLSKQWSMINDGTVGGKLDADIDADQAWDISTGGITATGDTIVVCVVDDGLEIFHDDIYGNVWVNRGEVPGDGMDNDNNGYIDDINGWNLANNKNDVTLTSDHGTPVSGIIGATGNNTAGVSGINWNIKLMTVKYEEIITESSVLTSYAYALFQRKLYNQTNGQKGAFVVAINSSWGINNGKAEDAPLWCAMYDSLGQAGILSIAATANSNVDVDQVGDLPTSCSSDFLITVTNTNRSDQKVTGAAYGKKHIDLGAPGAETYTISQSGMYRTFGGTSAAAPHVTGSVALLYSHPCSKLMQIAKQNPAIAARAVKEIILNGVDSTGGVLSSSTTSRGRLNIGKSMVELNDFCSSSGYAYGFDLSYIGLGKIRLSWAESEPSLITDVRYRPEGAQNWITVNDIGTPYTIQNLISCQSYELQVRSYPSGTVAPGFGYSRYFTSEGCCPIPQISSSMINIEGQLSVKIRDLGVNTEVNKNLWYRKYGQLDWNVASSQSNQFLVNSSINECEMVEFRLFNVCPIYGNKSDTTNIVYVTRDCGDCTAKSYCTPISMSNSEEWLASVKINGQEFKSEKGASYYSTYTGGFIPTLQRGKTYPVELVAGFRGASFSEYFVIYADLNNDGVFDPELEKVMDPNMAMSLPVSDSISLPITANLGLTRMRVIMSFSKLSPPCGPTLASNAYGEVEDYCLMIEDFGSNTNEGPSHRPKAISLSTSLVHNELFVTIPPIEDGEGALRFYNSTGHLIHQMTTGVPYEVVHRIEVKDWPADVYHCIFRSSKGTSTAKFIKY